MMKMKMKILFLLVMFSSIVYANDICTSKNRNSWEEAIYQMECVSKNERKNNSKVKLLEKIKDEKIEKINWKKINEEFFISIEKSNKLDYLDLIYKKYYYIEKKDQMFQKLFSLLYCHPADYEDKLSRAIIFELVNNFSSFLDFFLKKSFKLKTSLCKGFSLETIKDKAQFVQYLIEDLERRKKLNYIEKMRLQENIAIELNKSSTQKDKVRMDYLGYFQ